MDIQAIGQDHKESLAIQGQTGPLMQRIIGAIKTASKETGVDFSYLMNKAAQESGFKADAKAKTSSATGLYQFTEQTWLSMVRQYGDKHGVGVLAEKIAVRADGSSTVQDSALRRQILNLRKNPEVSAAMAAELAQENKNYLQTHIGGTIGNTELYLAHFLGPHGAAQFIQAARNNPEAKAAALLPDAAGANKSVFFNAEGKQLSVAQIYDRFAAKMDGKGVEIPDTATPTMVADVSDILNRIPNLALEVHDRLNGAQIPSALGSTVRSAGNTDTPPGFSVSAESLFSVMALAQLDALNFGDVTAKGGKKDSGESYFVRDAKIA